MKKTCECGCGVETKISMINRAKYGWVKGQPVRFVRGHWSKMTFQFSTRYEICEMGYASPCWMWRGCVDKDGYGVRIYQGRKTPAHRASYLDTCGPIEKGLVLDHLCMNHGCVNPDHLEAITSGDNTRRYWNWRKQVTNGA